jgi:hypothetical protein
MLGISCNPSSHCNDFLTKIGIWSLQKLPTSKTVGKTFRLFSHPVSPNLLEPGIAKEITLSL